MSDRKLATIEAVGEITPIPDADLIEVVRIRGGWNVVVQKNQFTTGERVVYFEIDSFLDITDPRFAFLAPRGVSTDPVGAKGHALKTARLRGVYSQGLAIPLADFPELDQDLPAGADVTDTLGIVKWDPPLPPELAGSACGWLPDWIPVTDAERIQNIPDVLAEDRDWVPTEKLDGCSTTFYIDPAADVRAGVCSRNVDLFPTDGNALWAMARKLQVHNLLTRLFPGQRVALQGETFGAGIRGNPLRLPGQEFRAFSLYVGDRECPRRSWPAEIAALSVPILRLPFPATVEQALADVETLNSAIALVRKAEGVVWRRADVADAYLPGGQIVCASFKAISQRYLLSHDC